MPTSTPLSASFNAIPLPIPRELPVTSACFPASDIPFSFNRNFRLDLFFRASYASPELDTTHLPQEQAPTRMASFWRPSPDKRDYRQLGISQKTQISSPAYRSLPCLIPPLSGPTLRALHTPSCL